MKLKRSLALGLVVLTSACGIKKTTSQVMASMAWDGQVVLEREKDVDLARQASLPLVSMLAVFGQSAPGLANMAALQAKGYGQYAYAFFEEDLLRYHGKDEAKYQETLTRARDFYQNGLNAGLQALNQKKSYRQALKGSVSELEKVLRSAGNEDVPLLFWTAFNWANLLNLSRADVNAVAALPKVEALISRVRELDPSYVCGSPLLFSGVIAASKPPMLGGNPAKAKADFEAAFKLQPNYLMGRVLFAQYYAVQVQDAELFEKMLREVFAADAGLLPEQELSNQLAKRRAQLLLERKNEFF